MTTTENTKPLTKKQKTEADRAESVATLKRMGVKPGTRVYTSITHVSSSGMSRHVRCYIVTRNTSTDRNGKRTVEHGITEITGLVANACGFRRARDGWEIVVGGCGMDMGFHVVYTLGRVMFPKGADKFVSGIRERQAEQDAKRNPGTPVRETDGGYLLKHERL